MSNIELPTHHSQVCVMTGVSFSKEDIPEFEKLITRELGVEVKYLETLITKPNYINGEPVKNTGGRLDVLFSIPKDYPRIFDIKMLKLGIQWIEEIIYSNDCICQPIYPDRVREYMKWDPSNLKEVCLP